MLRTVSNDIMSLINKRNINYELFSKLQHIICHCTISSITKTISL